MIMKMKYDFAQLSSTVVIQPGSSPTGLRYDKKQKDITFTNRLFIIEKWVLPGRA